MTNRHEPDPYAPNHELRPEDLRLTAVKGPHRDYIVPDGAVEPELLIAKPRYKRKKEPRPVRTFLLILLACLLGIVAVAAATVLFLQHRGRQAMIPDVPVEIVLPDVIIQKPEVEVLDQGRVVKYNGETYRFNENRTNILCIGVDRSSLGAVDGVVGTGGQADTIILLSIDTSNGDLDALAISRDAIVDIDLFAEDGTFVGTERTQICLSYAYGDGRETSSETTVRAASRLLYGVPINTYMTVDLDSIATLNDAIGGVELILLSDLVRADGTMSKAGDYVTLWGNEAMSYVRSRDTEQLASNLDRMARQKQYLAAFAEKAINATKADLQLPLDLYELIADDAITSLTPSKITFLATSLVRHNQTLSFASVPGEVVKGDDGYAEFVVDEQALYEQVLDIFYIKE